MWWSLPRSSDARSQQKTHTKLSIVGHSVEVTTNICKSLRKNYHIPVANRTAVDCTWQCCSLIPSTRAVHHRLGQWFIEVWNTSVKSRGRVLCFRASSPASHILVVHLSPPSLASWHVTARLDRARGSPAAIWQSIKLCLFFFLFFFLSLLFRLIIRIVSAQVVLYLYKARRLVLDWMEHRRCRVRCVLCAVRPRNAPARGGAREITITAAKKMIKMIKMIAYELLTVRSTPSARRCLGGVSFHVAVPGLTSRTTYRIPYKAGPWSDPRTGKIINQSLSFVSSRRSAA